MSKLYWIGSCGAGRLAIARRPRAGNGLAEDLEMMRFEGIDRLVSFLPQAEAAACGLEDEARLAAELGIEFINFPISDFSLPEGDEAALALLDLLLERLHRGENLALHCRMGIGRSGMFSAALLVLEGHTPDEAWRMVSRGRGMAVPDTAQQREWVERLAAATK